MPRQLVNSPAMETYRSQTRLGQAVSRLAEESVYEAYFRPTAGKAVAESGALPEVEGAEELLAALSEASVPLEWPAQSHVPVGAVEVLAVLVALIWLSAWTGFWFQEAVRADAPAPLALNRFALATELASLAGTTKVRPQEDSRRARNRCSCPSRRRNVGRCDLRRSEDAHRSRPSGAGRLLFF
jgi:hypothetical protein